MRPHCRRRVHAHEPCRSIPNLEKLLAHAQVAPAANQVELHPYLPQPELVKYCQDKGIVVEAYSPLGSTDSPLLKEEKVVQIAKKHGSQVGNVLISYQSLSLLLDAWEPPLTGAQSNAESCPCPSR